MNNLAKYMQKIILEKTDITPRVEFDHEKKELLIEGDSRPENTSAFYQPLIDWIKELSGYAQQYRKEKGVYDLKIKFCIDYVSSSSLKYIYDILINVEELKTSFDSVTVYWNYLEGDIDMKENGEEFASMVNLNFLIEETK